MSRRPAISVTIPTWRRRDLLEQLLESLERQTLGPSEYEIVVCDSRSPDGTAEMVASQAARWGNIRYLPDVRNTLAAKRNAGIAASESDVVIFLDDDVVADRRLVEAHLTAHAQGDRVAWCGQVRFPPEWVRASNYCRFRDAQSFAADWTPPNGDGDLPYHRIVVMNLSIRKRDLPNGDAGWVSEAFDRYGCEDMEFGARLEASGVSLRYLPDALVHHHEHNASLAQYLRKIYVYARDSVPVLERVAPSTARVGRLRWIEPAVQTRAGERVAGALLRASLRVPAWRLARAFLDWSDHRRPLYSPLLFTYVTAASYAAGVHEREAAPRAPESWFETDQGAPR